MAKLSEIYCLFFTQADSLKSATRMKVTFDPSKRDIFNSLVCLSSSTCSFGEVQVHLATITFLSNMYHNQTPVGVPEALIRIIVSPW